MSFTTLTTHEYVTSPSRKLEAKEAAHNRFKYGSPKLRDLLRKQCRDRLKERRNNNFIGKRNLLHDERVLMESVVKQGISQFEQDEMLQDLIYKELRDEMEQWLVDETNYLSGLDTLEEVICPLCQTNTLWQDAYKIGCSCSFRTKHYNDLKKLGERLKLVVLQHEVKCTKTLIFYCEPSIEGPMDVVLNAICDECDFNAVI